MSTQASKAVRVAIALIAANWLLWTSYCVAIGGSALGGEISGGQYLIRRHPGATPTSVTAGFWLFSLIYTFLTVSGSVLAIVLLHVFHRPAWDRGTLDKVGVGLALAWVLIMLSKAVPRFMAWAAAAA